MPCARTLAYHHGVCRAGSATQRHLIDASPDWACACALVELRRHRDGKDRKKTGEADEHRGPVGWACTHASRGSSALGCKHPATVLQASGWGVISSERELANRAPCWRRAKTQKGSLAAKYISVNNETSYYRTMYRHLPVRRCPKADTKPLLCNCGILYRRSSLFYRSTVAPAGSTLFSSFALSFCANLLPLRYLPSPLL